MDVTRFDAPPYSRSWRCMISTERPAIQALLLALVIVLIWIWYYGKTTLAAWRAPLSPSGDYLLFLGYLKAYMDGDIGLLLLKTVAHLNAPFTANWNDYPLTVEIVPAVFGLLARWTGLLVASNLMYLSAHILAGVSFWCAGLLLRYRWPYVWAGSLLYAFSPYIIARNALQHPTLSYYWHLPLLVVAVGWILNGDVSRDRFKNGFCWVVSLIAGVFSPYYSFVYLQFLLFAFLLHWIRRQRGVAGWALAFIAVTLLGFLSMNLDTISYGWLHGANPQAVVRDLSSLIYYGLKLPDLFFPPAHRWGWWAAFAQDHYHAVIRPHGEGISPYLGWMGLVGLAWLMGLSVYRLLQGRPRLIPTPAWQTLWVILYGVMGGINLWIGAFGLQLFRGTNRYSIIILTLALLFLVRQLSRRLPSFKQAAPLGFFIVLVGLWDQLPSPLTAEATASGIRAIQADESFARRLEERLPKGAMVFQLPVMPYPEFPPIQKMQDYEHFRPYLHTENLRYSYGNTKGRGDESWQNEVAALSPGPMIATLESYGFSALYLNRKGFKDGAGSLVQAIKQVGKPVIAESSDLIAFQLELARNPVLPQATTFKFGTGFYHEERNPTTRWSWSSGNAQLIVKSKSTALGELTFRIRTLKKRHVWLVFAGERYLILDPAKLDAEIRIQLPLTLENNIINFETDTLAELPGNGDPRELAFSLENVEVKLEPN